jgi:hypothetical protein
VKLLSTAIPAPTRVLSLDTTGRVVRKMRSKELDLNAYDTDKIKLRYLEIYDPILVPWIGKTITLLEIGGDPGGSLKLW